jgi:pimeloyl-ACP methyl ester carboxylesterase
MEPFLVKIDEQTLSDLRKRLAATRWTDEIENSNWEAGTNLAYLRELCTYWEREFDWTKQEAYLNTFQHYKTNVDDLGIHFILEKGKGSNSIPLLLLHGYPDSFTRFLKIIPLLTKADENDFSFDVVVPSLPGYGFSDIPKKAGMNTKRMAGLFETLMTKELGYEKFVVHGGDWGGGIAENIALYHEDSLFGMHLTDVPFHHSFLPIKDPTSEEKKYQEEGQKSQMTERAYAMIQSTKPQSLAYGLNDSPAGLAAWIVEKFKSWSDNDGNIENAFTKDELLTNITIYWATQTINSSFRLYYETMKWLMNSMYNPLQKINPFDKTGNRTTIPAAFTIFSKDISPPKALAERFFNVQKWSVKSKGGHFAAMEQPAVLARDIREFFSELHNVSANYK